MRRMARPRNALPAGGTARTQMHSKCCAVRALLCGSPLHTAGAYCWPRAVARSCTRRIFMCDDHHQGNVPPGHHRIVCTSGPPAHPTACTLAPAWRPLLLLHRLCPPLAGDRGGGRTRAHAHAAGEPGGWGRPHALVVCLRACVRRHACRLPPPPPPVLARGSGRGVLAPPRRMQPTMTIAGNHQQCNLQPSTTDQPCACLQVEDMLSVAAAAAAAGTGRLAKPASA